MLSFLPKEHPRFLPGVFERTPHSSGASEVEYLQRFGRRSKYIISDRKVRNL
jgi:hypothetical protein